MNTERRKRTTKILIAVPTTFKEVAKLLDVSEGTVAKRYHRIKDKHPRCAVRIEALAESHKTRAYKGKY